MALPLTTNLGGSNVPMMGPMNPNTVQLGMPQMRSQPGMTLTPEQMAAMGIPTAGNQVVPQTGLIGSEIALGQGANAAFNAVNDATTAATDTLNTAANGVVSGTQLGMNLLGDGVTRVGQAGTTGQGYLDTASNTVGTNQNAAQTFLGGAQGDNSVLTSQAAQLLASGETKGLDAIRQAVSGARTNVADFRDPGVAAGDLQAALSGALGPEAQAEAFATFQDDPGQQFLRDRGERAIKRNAAAIGGLGGGNVRKELIEFGQGLAAQQLEKRQQQLAQLADRGLSAQGQDTQLAATEAQLGSSLIADMARAGAQNFQQGNAISADLAGKQASTAAEFGRQSNDIAKTQAATELETAVQEGTLTRAQADTLMKGGDLYTGLAESLASTQVGSGNRNAEIALGTGELLSRGRTDAGNNIADSISNATTALTEILQSEGTDLSNVAGNEDEFITNLLSSLGPQNAQSLQELAAILANISTGSASTISGLPGIPGVQEVEGDLEKLARAFSGAGTGYSGFKNA